MMDAEVQRYDKLKVGMELGSGMILELMDIVQSEL